MIETLEVGHHTATPQNPKDPRSGLKRAWFPLRFDLAEQQEFKKLVPRKKVILADILYRLGEHLGLYEKGWRERPYYIEPDDKWAARLRVSVETFRAARQTMGRNITGRTTSQDLGWFDYRPGHGDRHGKLYATEYHAARFARIRKGERARCAAIDRHTWAVLVAALKQRNEPLEHIDLAVYISLAYLWERCGGPMPDKDSILVRKREIESLSGVKIAAFMRSVARLSTLKGPPGDVTARLFDFRTNRHGKQWIVEIIDWQPIQDRRSEPHGSL